MTAWRARRAGGHGTRDRAAAPVVVPAATVLAALAGLLVPAAPARGAEKTGGAASPSSAEIAGVFCKARCAKDGAVLPGGTVRVRGSDLARAHEVIFLGGPGNADDVIARALRPRPRSVEAKVPEGAIGGRVRVREESGAQSPPSVAEISVLPAGATTAPARGERTTAESRDEAAPDAAQPGLPLRPGSAAVDTSDRIDARVDTRTVFFAGLRKATFRYVVTGDEPLEVAVDVLRVGSPEPVARWTPGPVAPDVEQRIVWDGTSRGKVVPQGRYRFRVTPLLATAAQASEQPVVEDTFRFLDHKFPVRGRHDYGSEIARFGAGRAGHSHQGHDVFAACGTPLVAARGGRVVRTAYQGNAGWYVVIDGDGTGVDYAYMHLQEPSPLKRGDRVATGQRIGSVGDTGVARGCHLHFEMWTAPGWYEGGRPIDPLAQLRAWDAQS